MRIYRDWASGLDIEDATVVFEVSNRVLKMFERVTILNCSNLSHSSVLVNLNPLAPSNVYNVYYLSRVDGNYGVKYQ